MMIFIKLRIRKILMTNWNLIDLSDPTFFSAKRKIWQKLWQQRFLKIIIALHIKLWPLKNHKIYIIVHNQSSYYLKDKLRILTWLIFKITILIRMSTITHWKNEDILSSNFLWRLSRLIRTNIIALSDNVFLQSKPN